MISQEKQNFLEQVLKLRRKFKFSTEHHNQFITSCFKEFLLLLRNLDGQKRPIDTNKI